MCVKGIWILLWYIFRYIRKWNAQQQRPPLVCSFASLPFLFIYSHQIVGWFFDYSTFYCAACMAMDVRCVYDRIPWERRALGAMGCGDGGGCVVYDSWVVFIVPNKLNRMGWQKINTQRHTSSGHRTRNALAHTSLVRSPKAIHV